MARMGRPPKAPVERFVKRMVPTDSGCIEWGGTVDRYGYGQFRPGGRETVHIGAHRWSYEHFVGPIGDGLQIDHLCRNRRCVNPQHLEPVTSRENVLRSESPPSLNARKMRCAKGHPLHGENLYAHGGRRYCKACRHEQYVSRRNRKAA